MKRITFFLVLTCLLCPLQAETYDYVWSSVFPNYEQQIPKSDFTLDNHFQIETDIAQGVTGPQFMKDNKAGLMLRLYANNTLQLSTLQEDKLTQVVFVIGGNGCASLAKVTPSVGQMDSVYTGKDATGSFREYRYYWSGAASSVTFTVGALCEYGYECVENDRTDAGTLMTKQLLITTNAPTNVENVSSISNNPCATAKLLHNGHLLIRKDGKTYNVVGQEMK